MAPEEVIAEEELLPAERLDNHFQTITDTFTGAPFNEESVQNLITGLRNTTTNVPELGQSADYIEKYVLKIQSKK